MHISSGVLCASPIIYRSQQLFSSRKQTCWLPFQKASAMGQDGCCTPKPSASRLLLLCVRCSWYIQM